jgi:hypothetical protein
MKRIVLALAACVVGLGLVGTASAAPHRGYAHHGARVHGRVFYKHDNFRYTRRVYDVRYHGYRYWSPVSNCWYYWDAPKACYTPCE